ncbi:DUF72 domain-containing protein [Desulfurococcaceae archaeon MEX13E-LK6-19]|nr:DUF72 domain-containing protein [Desulfurococcaceae archaeon MEX13E-LK6-19]
MLQQKIWVGCCGFPVSRKKYYQHFKIVELQNTFYNLPSSEWARKFKEELPEEFIVSIKAWQVITHPSSSPTWKKMKDKPSGEIKNYGWLKPTKENIDAWNKIVDLAKIIGAKFIVLQTPGSMPYNEESVRWVYQFFKEIISLTPREIVIGWEPRGQWLTANAIHDLEKILNEYNVVHIVDLFKHEPVTRNLLYTRLHGIGKGEVNYRYKYTDDDLNRLANIIMKLGLSRNYVLFNNVYMFNDALRFKEMLSQHGFTVF